MAAVMTALQIIQQAAMELGLPKPAAVASSQEATGIQMLALLNTLGDDLVVAHPWQEISFIHSFATQVGLPSYPLPENYYYYTDQTFWDTANNWPLIGPLSAQQWQTLSAGLSTLVPRAGFRIFNNKVELFPTPSIDAPSDNISFQYVSGHWVEDGETPGVYKSSVTADSDIPLLNSNLLVKGLKVRMWSAKGLNTDSLSSDFKGMFEFLIGKDKGAPVLSMSPRAGALFVSQRNVPDGNWNGG